jgi:hypothetical protein
MKHLPQRVLEQVIAHYDLHLNDDSMAPGGEGKNGFFQRAIGSNTFLPLGLQVTIDIVRGNTSQRDYLFQQPAFADKYYMYH